VIVARKDVAGDGEGFEQQQERKKLSSKSFALPGKRNRRFPSIGKKK
jgi:hypothetical protein